MASFLSPCVCPRLVHALSNCCVVSCVWSTLDLHLPSHRLGSMSSSNTFGGVYTIDHAVKKFFVFRLCGWILISPLVLWILPCVLSQDFHSRQRTNRHVFIWSVQLNGRQTTSISKWSRWQTFMLSSNLMDSRHLGYLFILIPLFSMENISLFMYNLS